MLPPATLDAAADAALQRPLAAGLCLAVALSCVGALVGAAVAGTAAAPAGPAADGPGDTKAAPRQRAPASQLADSVTQALYGCIYSFHDVDEAIGPGTAGEAAAATLFAAQLYAVAGMIADSVSPSARTLAAQSGADGEAPGVAAAVRVGEALEPLLRLDETVCHAFEFLLEISESTAVAPWLRGAVAAAAERAFGTCSSRLQRDLRRLERLTAFNSIRARLTALTSALLRGGVDDGGGGSGGGSFGGADDDGGAADDTCGISAADDTCGGAAASAADAAAVGADPAAVAAAADARAPGAGEDGEGGIDGAAGISQSRADLTAPCSAPAAAPAQLAGTLRAAGVVEAGAGAALSDADGHGGLASGH